MKMLKLLFRLYILLKPQYGWNIVAIAANMLRFLSEYTKYAAMPSNSNFSISFLDWYPCLTDKTATTPLDPVYFYQDAWAARKIFENKPKHHYDVGSSAKTIAIISQFIPTTMVDIRPVELQLENLYFQKGSILELPFEDNSIDSISSLCVVEHIGLGRYGDPLDPLGSEKAIAELVRVTKPGGYIYFSVPVEKENKVYFNGHKSFSKNYLLQLFLNCYLKEERYIINEHLSESFQESKGYTVGLFLFTKNHR